MRMPGADRAYVDPIKVRDYLLSATHRFAKRKCAAFERVGYRRNNWQLLQRDLEVFGRKDSAEEVARNAYGRKYVVRGIIYGPTHRALGVATIWIVRDDEDFPRLVTVYPWSGP